MLVLVLNTLPDADVEMSKPAHKDSTLKSTPKPSLWRRLLQIALVIIIIICAYILFLQFSPQKKQLSTHEQDLFIAAIKKEPEINKLIIPEVGVNSQILEGDYKVLDKGVWHRYPERGNPEVDGNFILAAHRYVFAWLPQRVNEQSILYNIDKINLNDSIYIDWQGKRYHYTVSEKRTVNPSEASIEDPSKDAKLTLYSCTLSGERDGREVIIARPTD